MKRAIRHITIQLIFAAIFFFAARRASAETLAAPFGGKAFALSDNRVACGALEGGWSASTDHKLVKPPLVEGAIGQSTDVLVAPNEAACATSKERVTLLTTGAWPSFDPQSVVLAVDDARVEVRGKHLRGTRLAWRTTSNRGDDECREPQTNPTGESCGFAVSPGIPADPNAVNLSWSPAGSHSNDEVRFDAEGRRAPPESFQLQIARIVLTAVARPNASLDASLGSGSVALRHPEAVLGADCSPATCVVESGALLVGSLPQNASAIPIRFRLAPRVFVRAGDAFDAAPIVRVPLTRCPMSVASGPLLRGVDTQDLVVRVEGRCTVEPSRMRFVVGASHAERIRVATDNTATYVFLRVGRVDFEDVAITATREEGDAFVVAEINARTVAAPDVHVALDIGEDHAIEFLPTNVDANAHVIAPSWDGTLSIAPLAGVYTVQKDHDRVLVRGAPHAGGLASMRITLGRDLPAPIGSFTIATLNDSVERSVRKANVPEDVVKKDHALVEVLCDDGSGPKPVAVAHPEHVPFDHKDACRLVLHRERLDPKDGTQKLQLDIDVTRVDGSQRAEARVNRVITLEPAATPRVLFLHGAENRFDRYSVRIAHVADDKHYDVAPESDGLPSAQWSIITGRGSARIYGTTAIPTGMYRVSDKDHSGILSLNFGVLARLTWLDSLGREGLLALETGILAVGLANDVSSTGHGLTQISTVAGLGFSVPIANRGLATEAAINLHAWFEYEPSRDFGGEPGNAIGFVFGPSISIGNLGADL